MRGFSAILLFCAIASAAQTDDAAQRALQIVADKEQRLNEAEAQEAAAKQAKQEKTNYLIQAQKKLNNLPGWRVISKAIARDKVKANERAAKAAAQQAKAAEQAAMQNGQQYIQAEEIYRAETGTYKDPNRVQYWQSRLQFTPPEQNPDEPATAEQVEAQTSDLMNMMQGGLDASSMGQIAGKASSIEGMTDKLMAQAMAGQGGSSNRSPASTSGPGIDAGRIQFSDKKGGPALSASRAAPKVPFGSISEATLREGKILLSDGRGERSGGRRSRDPWAEKSRQKLAAGDAEGALAAAEKVIERNPRSPTGYVLKAQALNKLRRFDEAENAALRALDRDPENEKAYKSLIWAQLHNGKADQASANASRLLRIQPDNAEAYLMRAFAKELLGDRAGMLSDLERAARLDPRYRGHLAKARAGERLFDPNAEDSEQLLEAMAYEEPAKRRRSFPLVAFGLVLLLASAGAPLLAAIKKRQRSTVGAGMRTSTLEMERRTERDAPEKTSEELLGDKYRLEQMVGRGGMGKVWKATDTTLDRPVAIKQMVELGNSIEQNELRRLYEKEARTLATLRHPAIVDIYEVLNAADGIYLVFEWVEGKTVHQMLAEEHKLPLDRVVKILDPVLEALSFAHSQGVVHRDLKPANIMVSTDGHVKLMDFGIARALGDGQKFETGDEKEVPLNLRTNTVAGTPAYRAPEASRGIVTPAFDIYSIGATFYEMLTGRMPFGPSGQQSVHATEFIKVSKLAPGIPAQVDAIVAFCMQTDHTRRFQDAKILLAELKKI